jgi:hypothetical protein
MPEPRFAHVVNLYAAAPGSAAAFSQDVTLRALRCAWDWARPRLAIDLCAAVFPDDEPLVPDFFSRRIRLSRSILDCTREHDGRRLPLLVDILSGAREFREADHVIFSNIDIAPMPYFYLSLAQLLSQGYDAFIVTRRTIHASFGSCDDLPLMYAEVGTAHPGCDCFVFKRDLLARMHLGRVVVGSEFVALALRANLTALAGRMRIFRDLHLTFHLGDERAWLQCLADAGFNEKEVDGVFAHLLAGSSSSQRQELLSLHADYLQRKMRLQERKKKGGEREKSS